MSSIAYVTNEKMIEYHRLNGNTTMNFWRLTKQKTFTDFQKGDLLFFLAKGSERRKEKGLVGYGKYVSTKTMTFNGMWNKYKTLNGYANKKELEDAILKINKNYDFKEEMNCIYLEDVVFFQAPVYLSDLQIKISNRIESYIYIDKEDPTLTSKILKEASLNGVDLWSTALTDDKSSQIKEEEIKHIVSVVNEAIDDQNAFSKSDMAKVKKLIKQNNVNGFELIKGSKTDCLKYNNSLLTIAMPFIFTKKNARFKLLNVIGKITLYKLLLKDRLSETTKVKFELVSNSPIPKEIKVILAGLNDE